MTMIIHLWCSLQPTMPRATCRCWVVRSLLVKGFVPESLSVHMGLLKVFSCSLPWDSTCAEDVLPFLQASEDANRSFQPNL